MTAVSVEKRYKTRGETRDILYWDPRCADAPPHARITVGNTSAHQQSHTASGRHDGWATERPQTDSLVDIDVTDISLNALQPLDNSVFPQLHLLVTVSWSWISPLQDLEEGFILFIFKIIFFLTPSSRFPTSPTLE